MSGAAADGFPARALRRALLPFASLLGTRAVLVPGEDPFPEGVAEERHVLVRVLRDAGADRVRPGRTVVGAATRIPVASGSATGVLVGPGVRDPAAVLREAFRLLQPGGAAVLVADTDAASARDLPEAVRDAALLPHAFVPVLAAGDGTSLPGFAEGLACHLASRRARRRLVAAGPGATGSVRVVLVALRDGGHDPPLPRSGDLLAELFVPRAFRRGEGDRDGEREGGGARAPDQPWQKR